MYLSRLLSQETISVGWPGDSPPKRADKWTLIADLLLLLAQANAPIKSNLNTCLKLVTEREKSMSTGIGDGVAIPHATVPNLKSSAAAMCVLKQGVDFSSIDRQPVRIVILMLMPKDQFQQHIQALAGISRLLHTDSNRKSFLKSSNSETLWKKINSLEEKQKKG